MKDTATAVLSHVGHDIIGKFLYGRRCTIDFVRHRRGVAHRNERIYLTERGQDVESLLRAFWKIHLYFTIRHRLRLELLIVDIVRLFRYGYHMMGWIQ